VTADELTAPRTLGETDQPITDPTEPLVVYKLGRVLCTQPGEYRFSGVGQGKDSAYDADSTATCAINHHHAPHPNCTCGFWGVYKLSDLAECTDNAISNHNYESLVRLTVEMSGPAELHDQGIRAYRQRVLHAAFPTHCSTLSCTRPTVALVHARNTPGHFPQAATGVRPVCSQDIRPADVEVSIADLCGALSTEVSITRDITQEGSDPPGVRRRPSRLKDSRLLRGYVLGAAVTLWTLGLFLMVSLIQPSPTWENLNPLITQAGAYPGAYLALDGTPVQIQPIRYNGTPVGATVFNLSDDHCYVAFHRTAPQAYFNALSTFATSYATFYPDPRYTQPYLSVTDHDSATLRTTATPDIVATTAPTTQALCAARAAQLSTTTTTTSPVPTQNHLAQ
jgi:hypothetical protein